MTRQLFSIDEYQRIMQYLEQATDEELMWFIEAAQQKWNPQGLLQERERAYKDWREHHEERYIKVQQIYPDRLRPGRGRPRKSKL